jgi:hypothetical protein
MATGRWYKCPCGYQRPKQPALLGALQNLAKKKMPPCPNCQTSMELHLKFDLALGAKGKDAVGLASFFPSSVQWENAGHQVDFYPFLVILKRSNGKHAVWLPYFHRDRDPKKSKPVIKYGQWAPFMELQLFEDLLGQARQAGLLS